MKGDELGVVNKSAENFLQNLFTKLSSFSRLQEDNRQDTAFKEPSSDSKSCDVCIKV